MSHSSELSHLQEHELVRVDAALCEVPREHLERPFGFRAIRRGTYLCRAGRNYPTIMGLYSRGSGTAHLYEGAFSGFLGLQAPETMLPKFPILCLVGCSLTQDEALFGLWADFVGGAVVSPSQVLLLEKEIVENALAFSFSGLKIRLELLPSGLDFALGYAAFLCFPTHLKKGSPKLYEFFLREVFGQTPALGSHERSGSEPARV